MNKNEYKEKHGDEAKEIDYYEKYGYPETERLEKCIYCDSTEDVKEKYWREGDKIKSDMICEDCYQESKSDYIN